MTEEIPDLTRKWEKKMKVELGEDKFVHRVKLRVAGETNGKFLLNGKEISPGKINKVIHDGDFYETGFMVRFKPVDEIKGHLKVYVTYYYTD